MNNILRIRTLTDRFFDGETSLAEEQELYAFYSQAPDALPEDLRPLRELFLDLQAVAAPAVVPPVATAPQPAARRRAPWLVAAAVAVLVVGGGLLLFHRSAPSAPAEEECVAYIYGQRTTDPDVVLSEMQKTMLAVSDDDAADIVEAQLREMFSN